MYELYDVDGTPIVLTGPEQRAREEHDDDATVVVLYRMGEPCAESRDDRRGGLTREQQRARWAERMAWLSALATLLILFGLYVWGASYGN